LEHHPDDYARTSSISSSLPTNLAIENRACGAAIVKSYEPSDVSSHLASPRRAALHILEFKAREYILHTYTSSALEARFASGVSDNGPKKRNLYVRGLHISARNFGWSATTLDTFILLYPIFLSSSRCI